MTPNWQDVYLSFHDSSLLIFTSRSSAKKYAQSPSNSLFETKLSIDRYSLVYVNDFKLDDKYVNDFYLMNKNFSQFVINKIDSVGNSSFSPTDKENNNNSNANDNDQSTIEFSNTSEYSHSLELTTRSSSSSSSQTSQTSQSLRHLLYFPIGKKFVDFVEKLLDKSAHLCFHKSPLQLFETTRNGLLLIKSFDYLEVQLSKRGYLFKPSKKLKKYFGKYYRTEFGKYISFALHLLLTFHISYHLTKFRQFSMYFPLNSS
jgi:hypothetical protein